MALFAYGLYFPSSLVDGVTLRRAFSMWILNSDFLAVGFEVVGDEAVIGEVGECDR